MEISLIIPLKNESASFQKLVGTILTQSLQPYEVIFVDGGSTDNTISLIEQVVANNPKFRLIKAGNAMPGKGRNIGATNATKEWLAFTDGGITLDKDWLQNLAMVAESNPDTRIIYGNFSPLITNFFDKCAAISYVAPFVPGKIRGKFIASSLIKKEVWEKSKGFPDWRAAEDIIFMERAERVTGHKFYFAPSANVYWQLRQSIISTFKRFDLYSKYNVWAGQQKYWHYGVARQYALGTSFALLGIFHNSLWFLLIPAWVIARTVKRIFLHRYQFGFKPLFSPFVFFTVMFLIVLIDAATFTGWIKAIFQKNKF
jgi:glycosyltransferase involved in cell wall biosynthesis